MDPSGYNKFCQRKQGNVDYNDILPHCARNVVLLLTKKTKACGQTQLRNELS